MLLIADWTSIYLNGFAAAALALLLWNALERRSEVAAFAPVVLLAGLLAMTSGLVLAQAELQDKLFFFARDLLVQAVAAYIVRSLSQRPKYAVPALLILGVVYWLFYREVQVETFRLATRPTKVADERAPGFRSYELLVYLPGGDSDLLATPGVYAERAFELTLEESPLSNYFAVDVESGNEAEVERLLSALEASAVYAEDNEQIHVEPVRNLPSGVSLVGPTPEVSGLDDPGVAQQWALSAWPYAAFAKTCREFAEDLRPTRLFVLDTGVDAEHPDLQKHYVSHEARSDRDVVGHGTHVAGIAAATANNGIGTAGWLPVGDADLSVSAINVFTPMGYATQRAVVQGIIDAANAGASVINLSLGGISTDGKRRAYNDAVAYAAQRGALVVVSAGNSATDARRFAPANSDGVIVVGALDNAMRPADFSNSLDNVRLGVWAPGKDIYSLVPNGGYTLFSGTSMAAPQVSGLLTVAKAIDPSLDAESAYTLLQRTTGVAAQAGDSARPRAVRPADFLREVARRR